MQILWHVTTYNDAIGLIKYQPVSYIYVYTTDKLTHITLNNEEVISTKPNHPIYVQNMGYIRAEFLRAGDLLTGKWSNSYCRANSA
ncbi:MAG: HINT domain-containing protein [Christensenellaceae bacterium]|nr:HINT domain-containing protein [Christensenellaceae bacterium]